MSVVLLQIAANLVAITFAVAAAYLAAHDKGGWGWFILCAVLTSATVQFKKANKSE